MEKVNHESKMISKKEKEERGIKCILLQDGKSYEMDSFIVIGDSKDGSKTIVSQCCSQFEMDKYKVCFDELYQKSLESECHCPSCQANKKILENIPPEIKQHLDNLIERMFKRD